MKRSLRGTLVFAAGLMVVLVPLLFGAARAITTGTDFRYLWVAVAELVGAAAVMTLGKDRGINVQGIFVLFVLAVAISTVIGRVLAAVIGATSSAAMWFVAFGFALCLAGGCALVVLSRTRSMGADWRASDQR